MTLPTTLGALHLDTIDVPATTRAPVLCLHGLFAGSWVFERLLPVLAQRGYPAAALSFRGHPPSASVPQLGRVTIGDFLDDATEAARALDRPIVVGHSLGGLVAQMLAARGLVRAAVLVAAAPPRGIGVLTKPLLKRMPRYLPALLASRPFLPRAEDLDALVLNCVPPADRAAARARLVADSGRAARQAALGKYAVPKRSVRVPILVVSGEDDRFIPLDVARRIARRYDAPLLVARGHGHFLLAEPGWEDQVRVVIDWLDDLPHRDEPVAPAAD
ncbi:MAG: alpha/beta hydrolase [Gemmatimonadaceae bacterium]